MKKNYFLIIISILLYLCNIIFKSLEFDLGIFSIFMVSYFNDILAGILLISFTNLLLDKVNREIKIFWKIECFLLLVGLFWEYVTPLYKTNSISDPYDIFAYLIGGIIYWIISKSNTK